jgi:HAD superfamily hydrolase (TIGR01509 family)
MGQNSRQWSVTMRRRLDLPLPPEAIEREIVDGVVDRYRREGPPVIADAVRVVSLVGRRFATAVASSAHREVIDVALRGLGLEAAFDALVSSDEVAHGKPEPDVYLEAARRLAVGPAACLVVEDSLNGVLAARAAGMAVVLVPNTSVPPAAGAREAATVVADRLADVLSILGLPDGLAQGRPWRPQGAEEG